MLGRSEGALCIEAVMAPKTLLLALGLLLLAGCTDPKHQAKVEETKKTQDALDDAFDDVEEATPETKPPSTAPATSPASSSSTKKP
jgi:hypothetical protein